MGGNEENGLQDRGERLFIIIYNNYNYFIYIKSKISVSSIFQNTDVKSE